jgi:hypothetical protein
MKENQDVVLDQALTPEEKANYLSSMSFSTETEKVRRDIPEDEKQQMKDFVVEESTIVMEKTAEMKQIVKEFTEALKKNKEGLKDALTRLKKGYTENEERVFLIDDQDNGLMNIHDKDGKFLYSRKLRPNEKQARLLNVVNG